MEYTLVNMGTLESTKDDKKKTYFALDIVITSKTTILKRVFVDKKTYDKLSSLFGDRLDMLTFDIGQYIVIEPNFKGEFVLKIFEELIQAI